MATYSEYNTEIKLKLGNTDENFWTPQMKAKAINDTIRTVLDKVDIPELIKRTTITTDADGIVDYPSDHFRTVKIWDVDSRGIQTNEYRHIENNIFDEQDPTASFYYTEDYVISAAARRLKILPAEVNTLQMRYVQVHTEVVTDSSTDSGLVDRWNETIAYGAAAKLLQNSGEDLETQKAVNMWQNFINTMKLTYNTLKYRGGFKHNPRFKSKFERVNMLQRRNGLLYGRLEN